MRYFGFDLGDGESCITLLQDTNSTEPVIIPINGEASFLSAVAHYNGGIVIGQHASGNPEATDLRVCFKRNFRSLSQDTCRSVSEFVRGITEALNNNEQWKPLIEDTENTSFVVGCPAGWSEKVRETYHTLLSEAGLPNVHIVSESRAALMYAVRSHIEGIDPALIRESILVIDIGSSTLDFAYVCDGRETNIGTMGDNRLGGGLLDEMIISRSLRLPENSEKAAQIENALEREPHWKSYLMLAAREIKERYFSDEDYYNSTNEALSKRVSLFTSSGRFDVILRMSPALVNDLINMPHALLDGQSFRSRIANSLHLVTQHTQDRPPRAVLLTGGASRMRFFQEMCEEAFTSSIVKVSPKPEFDIARGLAYAGLMDDNLDKLLKAIKEYVDSDTVEKKVESDLTSLINTVSDALSGVILEKAVLPTYREWRGGNLSTLNDFEKKAAEAIRQYMQTDDTQQIIRKCALPWTSGILSGIQQDIDKLCRTYGIDVGRMQLKDLSLYADNITASGLDIPIVTVIDYVVGIVVTVVMAALSGGTGTALMMEGPIGWIIGAVIGVLAAVMGKQFVEKIIKSVDVPKLFRKLVRESAINNDRNLEKMSSAIKNAFLSDTGLKRGLTAQIAEGIERAINENAREQAMQIG